MKIDIGAQEHTSRSARYSSRESRATARGKNTRAQEVHKKNLLHYRSRLVRLCTCALVLSAIFIAGCGYTTSSTLTANIKTIRIEPFKNSIDFTAEGARNIYLPLLEVKARNEVVKRFLYDGNLKVVDTPDADLVLKGELKQYNRGGLRYTDDDDVQEYRVQVIVSFELTNTHNEEFSWSEPGFVGEATYFVTGALATTEESAVDAAILDLARRIVERTIEDW